MRQSLKDAIFCGLVWLLQGMFVAAVIYAATHEDPLWEINVNVSVP